MPASASIVVAAIAMPNNPATRNDTTMPTQITMTGKAVASIDTELQKLVDAGPTARVLSAENLLRARTMAEAWDEHADACDVPMKLTA